MSARERFERLTRVFECVAAVDPSARESEIERLCGDDASLQRDVRAMLAADDSSGATDPIRAVIAHEAEAWIGVPAVGESVGRYTVVGHVGEGGMGAVLAAHDDTLHRRVAVKLLRGAPDHTRRQRMLREAQAMARLNHPNVVPVFEIGEHGEQLFVAMELVDGMTLRAWQRTNPEWRDVLHKYLQAGRGLAAAHAEGLVHRDFKPHNAVVGEDGRVRVLDFGLAAWRGEAAESSASEGLDGAVDNGVLGTALTRTGAVMGTPAYMAPEQFTSGHIDHRSDQFSFCVALWEALYGAPPYAGEFPAARFVAITHGTLCEPERSDVPPGIRSALARGLRPNPAERWPALPQLLDALARAAVDPAKSRRRRWLAASVVLTVVAFAFGAPAVRDRLREREAAQCEAVAAGELAAIWNDDVRDRVRDRILVTDVPYAATTAVSVIPRLDAYASGWHSQHAAACVDAYAGGDWSDDDLRRARACFDQQKSELRHLVDLLAQADEVTVENAVGAVAGLPLVDECGSVASLRRSPQWSEQADDADVIRVREMLTNARALLSTGKPGQALEEARTAEADASTLGRDGLRVDALFQIALASTSAGQYEAAADAFERAYFGALAAHDLRTASKAASRLVFVVGYSLDRHDEAMQWHRHAEAAAQGLGMAPEDHDTGTRLRHVGVVHEAAGRYDEAAAVLERALAIEEAALGRDHPYVGDFLNSLALVRWRMGDHAESEALYERALQLHELSHGPEHPSVALVLNNLASLHGQQGDYERARSLLERALRIREAALGPDHPDVGWVVGNLGQMAAQLGDLEGAEAMLTRALAIFTAALGPDHLQVAACHYALGEILRAQGRFAEAKTSHERALAVREPRLAPSHPELVMSLMGVARAQAALGEHEQATRNFMEAARREASPR